MSRTHRTTMAVPRAVHGAARVLAVAAVSATLGGCYTMQQNVAVPPFPNDYRERHPIVVQERSRTVELFVGQRRGELLPAQRATVLAFGRDWTREATGGV